MSSAANYGGGDGAAATSVAPPPQQYFCYQCNRAVSVAPTSDPVCPICNGGFLEEYENSNPRRQPFFGFSTDIIPYPSGNSVSGDASGGFPAVFSTSSGGELHNPINLSIRFGGPNRSPSPDGFNPLAFLQDYLNPLRDSGASVQLVVENSGSDLGGQTLLLPANLDDYFIGPGFEQLIQQLAENDPNRYGTPPASKTAIEALPNINISQEVLEPDNSQCAVCKDTFELNEEVKKMPCEHLYHSDCILPWLQLHSSCPVCRCELPADDSEYENRSRENSNPTNSGAGTAAGSGGGGGSQENPITPWTAERRFHFTLPWPFRTVFGGTPAETSNSGSSSNSGGDSGGNNNGNLYSGGQAREEDLD